MYTVGSTRQLVYWTGTAITISDTYSYDGYGVMLQDETAAQNDPGYTPQQDTNLLYAGEHFDSDSQQYYNRARWYNPLNGRFNRTDPFAGNSQDPQSLHKYLYTYNNPVNSIDPSGLFSLSSVSVAMVIRASLYGMYWGATYPGIVTHSERMIAGAARLNFSARQKESANATIIVHGIAPHVNGWSNDFVNQLESRAANQDYYEFTWSGFSLTGALGINAPVHNIALNSLIQAAQIVRQKGYSKVNIIAHSWGTVLSRDAQYAGIGDIDTWVTMGSPLPESMARHQNLNNWVNFYSHTDPVVDFGPRLHLTGVEGGTGSLWQRTGDIQQHMVSGGHNSYWTNNSVLSIIGHQLSGQ